MKQKLDNLIIFLYIYKKKHPKRVMTVLVFVVIPLITGMILGYEMSGNVAMHIPTVVVDHDNSAFSRDLVQYISDNEYFDVIELSDNDARVKDAIYHREAFAGVIVPEDFYRDLIAGKAPKIMTFIDGTTLAASSYSSSALTEIIETLKTGYMMKIYEGKLNVSPEIVKNHAIPIDVTYRLLYNPERNFRNFILPGILAALVQVGISCMGAERAGELRGKGVKFTGHIRTIINWSALGAMSIGITLLEQILFFDMPYRSTVTGGALLTFLYSAAVLTAGYVVGSVIPDRTFASQAAAIIVLPTPILGGYTWPVIAMPAFFQHFAKILPFYYYGSEIRSLCLAPLKFQHLIPTMGVMCIFIAVEMGLLFLIKRKEAAL